MDYIDILFDPWVMWVDIDDYEYQQELSELVRVEPAVVHLDERFETKDPYIGW